MRIAIINWSNRLAGGVETYLRQVIPALRQQGHEIAFVHEVDEPAGREVITPVPTWCTTRSGVGAVLQNLSAWRPDLLYIHRLRQHDWLLEIVKTIPAVF